MKNLTATVATLAALAAAPGARPRDTQLLCQCVRALVALATAMPEHEAAARTEALDTVAIAAEHVTDALVLRVLGAVAGSLRETVAA